MKNLLGKKDCLLALEFELEPYATTTFVLKNNNMNISVNDGHVVISTTEEEIICYEIFENEKCVSVKMHIINPNNYLSKTGCTYNTVFTMEYGKQFAPITMYSAVMEALEGHLRPWTEDGYEKYLLN